MATTYTTEAQLLAAFAAGTFDTADTLVDGGKEWGVSGDLANGLVILVALGASGGGGASVSLTPAQELMISTLESNQQNILGHVTTSEQDIADIKQSQAIFVNRQTALEQAQAVLETLQNNNEILIHSVGDPLLQTGAPYTLDVAHSRRVVIVDAAVQVPVFTTTQGPASINVFNSSGSAVSIAGSNYTGITEISGKGVATFIITNGATTGETETEGVGGRT